MVSRWQKNYEDEAKELIRRSVREYNETVRMSNIITKKLCEVGDHKTEGKLKFCKYCKRSFCKIHGDLKKGVCNACLEIYDD